MRHYLTGNISRGGANPTIEDLYIDDSYAPEWASPAGYRPRERKITYLRKEAIKRRTNKYDIQSNRLDLCRCKEMSYPLEIFLDSTVFYNDPFFRSTYGRLILQYAEQENSPLLVSRVVLDEARHNLECRIPDVLQKLMSATKSYGQISREDLSCNPETPIAILQQFDDFCRDLISRRLIRIVEVDNSLLPEVIRRAIQREKPFTEKKQEFRDCVTWLSYCRITETEDMDECIFVTGNYADFYSGDRIGLHSDLRRDSERFTLYSDLHCLFDNEPLLDSFRESEEARTWADENVTESFAWELLTDHFHNRLQSFLNDLFQNMQPLDLDNRNIRYIDNGYVQWSDFDVQDVEKIEWDVADETVIIRGEIVILCTVQVHLYNPGHDSWSDKWSFAEERSVAVSCWFSITTDKTGSPQDLELGNCGITLEDESEEY